MRKTCLNMVYQLAKEDPRIFFVGSDLGAGTLDIFKKEMPERFFMEGVSEANVVGMAAGLALEGKIVYINTIATFFVRRCFEQIVLDLCLHRASVRVIGNGGGLVYAPLGPTHLMIEDLAILRAVPNMTLLAPADAAEMRALMPQTVDYPGPIYIRLAKGGEPVVTEGRGPLKIGKALLAKEGRDALVVTTGITLRLALEAAGILEKQGLKIGILHTATIKPLDTQAILGQASKIPAIVTIEEGTVCGGLGSAVAELLAEAGFKKGKRFRRIGIPDAFANQYGSQETLLQAYAITVENLVATILDMVQ